MYSRINNSHPVNNINCVVSLLHDASGTDSGNAMIVVEKYFSELEQHTSTTFELKPISSERVDFSPIYYGDINSFIQAMRDKNFYSYSFSLNIEQTRRLEQIIKDVAKKAQETPASYAKATQPRFFSSYYSDEGTKTAFEWSRLALLNLDDERVTTLVRRIPGGTKFFIESQEVKHNGNFAPASCCAIL